MPVMSIMHLTKLSVPQLLLRAGGVSVVSALPHPPSAAVKNNAVVISRSRYCSAASACVMRHFRSSLSPSGALAVLCRGVSGKEKLHSEHGAGSVPGACRAALGGSGLSRAACPAAAALLSRAES